MPLWEPLLQPHTYMSRTEVVASEPILISDSPQWPREPTSPTSYHSFTGHNMYIYNLVLPFKMLERIEKRLWAFLLERPGLV